MPRQGELRMIHLKIMIEFEERNDWDSVRVAAMSIERN